MDFSCLETDLCAECKRAHHAGIRSIHIGAGALDKLPEELKMLGSQKVFLLSDVNTFPLAGDRICKMLENNGFSVRSYSFPQTDLEPDEFAVGSAVMHFDLSCDTVVALGSGVINDIGKILSAQQKTHYVIVGTAPSMDGYASATSSLARDGLKISLPSRCAEVIIGDTDILKNAPMKMLKAGLGDMLAKYVSICEWRIANLILGEYYCPAIAELVRNSLKKCIENAKGLLSRNEQAVEAVMEGLVITGVAMNLAGVSRPASGIEHYISHIWDMRALEFGLEADLHGLQCAAGTYISAKLYHKLLTVSPDAENAKAKAIAFSYEEHKTKLRTLLGKGAEAMILLEKKEGKYDPEKHNERLPVILKNWDKICTIVREEIPSLEEIESLFEMLGLDKKGTDPAPLSQVFSVAGDIRDKYVLPRLVWDLGVMDEFLAELEETN